jgi:hypothetical protein
MLHRACVCAGVLVLGVAGGVSSANVILAHPSANNGGSAGW